jgi:NH3-dependent NAD+ synthetase
VANAMVIATLCGSYKAEVAALSKLNLARKILAHVSQAISHDTPSADLRSNRQRGSLAASQMIDLHKVPVHA